MRVLLVTSERAWRGGEVQLRLLACGLAEAGIAVQVACPLGSQAAGRLAADGLAVEPLPLRGAFSPMAIPRLRGLCRHADIVHAYTPNAHGASVLALIGGGPPLVSTRHLDLPPRRGWWSGFRQGRTRLTICVSEAVRRAQLAGGMADGRLRTIRCAIDIHRARSGRRAEARAALGLAEGDLLVLSAAALVEQKDPRCLLAAWRSAAAAFPQAHLALAGDGPLEAVLRAAQAPRLHLLGRREDVPDLMAAADLYVSAARFEGLPLAIMEAQAAGLAVLATPAGGTPELIEDGVDGLLSPIGDAAALAEGLGRLLADAALRQRLGAAAAVRAEGAYGPERLVEEHLAAYAEMLGAGSGGQP